MKIIYGIFLILMVFVSACAQQPAKSTSVTEPEASVEADVPPEADVEGTGAAVAEPEEEIAETTSNEIRYVGAGGFDSDGLTISTGSAVTWINDDEKKGAVVIFKDGRSYMNSNGLRAGEKFEVEFTEAGEYEFWWNIALAGNSGKITVE